MKPCTLNIDDTVYHLLTGDEESNWFSEYSYARTPGRTDNFLFYQAEGDPNGEILVHSPATLKLHSSSNFKPVAIKMRPWRYSEILGPVTMQMLRLPDSDFGDIEQIERIIGYDKLTEGDALRFFNYVAESKISMPEEFWPVLLLWLRDEINHFEGFKAVYHKLFGFNAELEDQILQEESDFEQFQSIMQNPFDLLVALTYDEASTISAYNHDMPLYDEIGQPMGDYVRKVASDEGWHFSKFADLAVKYFPQMCDDVPQILAKVTELDGRKYRRTFFLDHDPRVEAQFNEEMKARSINTVINTFERRLRIGIKSSRI